MLFRAFVINIMTSIIYRIYKLKEKQNLNMITFITEAGAKKCVAQNVIPLMLSMYQESHRFDHRNRNMAVRRALLSVIKSCVNFGMYLKFLEDILTSL